MKTIKQIVLITTALVTMQGTTHPMQSTSAYVSSNHTRVLVIAAGVCVTALGYFGYKKWKKSRQDARFGSIKGPIEAGLDQLDGLTPILKRQKIEEMSERLDEELYSSPPPFPPAEMSILRVLKRQCNDLYEEAGKELQQHDEIFEELRKIT